MAIEDRPFDEEDQKQQSQQNPLSGTGSSQQNPSTQSQSQTTSAPSETKLTSGSSGTVGPGAATNSSPNQKSSGRFTNLQNFITANQNFNAQGGGLAGKIGQNVANTQNKANAELQNAQQTFGQAVNTQQQNIQNATQGALGGIKQITGSTPGVSNAEAINAVQAGLNTKYTGPEQLGNLERLQQNQQNLSAIQNATQTEGGRFGLLQKYFNKPTYTSGQQKLDQLVLQANPNQVSGLQQVARNAGAYNQNMQNATNQAVQQATAAKALAQTNQQAVGTELSNQEKGITDQLNQQVAAAQAAEQANADKARSLSNNVDVSNYLQQASDMGIPLTKAQILGAAGIYNQGQANISNIDPDKLNVYNTLAGINKAQTYDIGNKYQQGSYGIDKSVLEPAFTAAQGYSSQIPQLENNLESLFAARPTDPMMQGKYDSDKTKLINAALKNQPNGPIAQAFNQLNAAKTGMANAFSNIYDRYSQNLKG